MVWGLKIKKFDMGTHWKIWFLEELKKYNDAIKAKF